MEHYKGLWNRAYLNKGPLTCWLTFYGELLSYNGTGETIVIFKLKELKVKKGLAFLYVHGDQEPKTILLKKRNWITQNKIVINN